MKIRLFRLFALMIILVIAGLWIFWQTGLATDVPAFITPYLPAAWQTELGLATDVEISRPVRATGIIQAAEINVASEFGGLITVMPVREGDAVHIGDILVQLDTAVIDAQIAAARVGVALAEAGLAQVKAGSRPTEIEIAEAQLTQADVGYWAAATAVSDTLALLENPQELRLEIAVTQAQINSASQRVNEAVANKDAIEVVKNRFEELNAEWGAGDRSKQLIASGSIDNVPQDLVDAIGNLVDGVYTVRDYELHISNGQYELYKWITINLPLSLHLTPNQWWQAWVGVNAATAQQEGLQRSLSQLYAQVNNPQVLAANVDEALAALAQADAQVLLAQAQLDGHLAGATEEQIALMEEQVTRAQGLLDALLAQRELLVLTALDDSVVIDRVLHPGEVAAAGAPIVTLARLQNLKLRVYVPETQFGRIFIGQPVAVTVDSFPDHVYRGTVSFIADRAEFTPRNVTTMEERALLVFAVDIHLPNIDSSLKPGMPADVIFLELDEVPRE